LIDIRENAEMDFLEAIYNAKEDNIISFFIITIITITWSCYLKRLYKTFLFKLISPGLY